MSDRSPAEDVAAGRIRWTDVVKYAIAVLALAGFSWIIIDLMGKTGSASEMEWTRAVYLLSGVEAIAFAAAGFIFGREVNRQRAEKAEKRASEAQAQKEESQQRAVSFETKGYALASAIRARKQTAFKSPATAKTFGEGPGAVQEIDALNSLANDLFPQK